MAPPVHHFRRVFKAVRADEETVQHVAPFCYVAAYDFFGVSAGIPGGDLEGAEDNGVNVAC
jgi:hypothetical protein